MVAPIDIEHDVIPHGERHNVIDHDHTSPTDKGGLINISGLDDIGAVLVATDTLMVDDGDDGTTKKTDISRIWDFTVTQIQALGNKATPVGADILMVQDSAAAFALKEVTITNLTSLLISDTAFDWTDWDGVTTIAPSKNAVRDMLLAHNEISEMADVTFDGPANGDFLEWRAVSGTWQDSSVSELICFVDEDNMASNSAVKICSQQSIKTYVDANSQGLKIHEEVVMATTENITRSGEQTIDGVGTSADRLLVKDQTNTEENGIYVTAGGAWSRAADMNAADEVAGSFVFVVSGTTHSNSGWACIAEPDGFVLNTTAMLWSKFSYAGYIDAGTGLAKTGNTLAVDGVLEDLDTLGPVTDNSYFLVGTGTGTFAWETTTDVRTSLGLGTGDSVTFSTLAGDGSALTGVGAAAPTALSNMVKLAEDINVGQAAYISGATGGFPQVLKCDNTDSAKTHFYGLMAESGTSGQNKLIRIAGESAEFNTASWDDGDELYLSTAGALTKTLPTSGQIVVVGHVSYDHASQGTVTIGDHHLPIFAVAAGDDITMRLGASDGSTSLLIKDYANATVAEIDDGGTVFAPIFDTYVLAAGLTMSGTTLAADGTDDHISVTVTPKGNGVFSVGADVEGMHILGKAKIGGISANDALYLSHYDNANANDYALKQTAAGGTKLNSATGQSILFSINDGTVAFVNSTGFNGALGGTTPFAGICTTLDTDQDTTLTGNVTDDYTAALRLDPAHTVTNGGNYTITRYNFMDLNQPTETETSGTIDITDGCIMRFDAAAGTHVAVDAGGGTTNIGTTIAWLKVNINGTIAYIPAYAGKTP